MWAWRPWKRRSVPGRDNIFSFAKARDSHSFLFNWYSASFPGIKEPEREADHSLFHLLSSLQKNDAVPPPTPPLRHPMIECHAHAQLYIILFRHFLRFLVAVVPSIINLPSLIFQKIVSSIKFLTLIEVYMIFHNSQ
jgi:hypothetical protein